MSSDYYKDVSWVDKKGKRSKQWYRININDIDKWVENAKANYAIHIFTTIQTFTEPQHRVGEEADMPFFVDLDGVTALEDVCKFIDYFEVAGLNSAYISIWFSGNKGFHITIPRQCFGVMPSPHLHKVWRIVGKFIAAEADVKSTKDGGSFDETVYSSRRMWRVENTLHGGSGLYKIPLQADEVKSLSLEHIRELAGTPQVSHTEEYAEKPIERLKQVSDRAESSYEYDQDFGEYKPLDTQFSEPPPCIRALLENGILQLGTTNMTMFRLAAYFKSQDISMADTVEIMNEWITNIRADKTHTLRSDGLIDLVELRNQVAQVCRSVFAGSQYSFSCKGVKQIPGLEEYCKPHCEEELGEKLVVTLFDASKAEYLGRRIYLEAEAVGRRDAAYIIPESVKVWCEPKNSPTCVTCPLFQCRDGLVIEVNAKSPAILKFLLPSNLPMTAKVGQLARLPQRKGAHGCVSWKYKITNRNAEIVFLAPKITNAFYSSDRYTRIDAFYLGHGLQPNQAYEFSGYSHVHEKSNAVYLVVDTANEVADSLTEFKPTAQMKRDSKIFEPSENETYEAKHDDIMRRIIFTKVRVWGRSQMLKAIDLAYHSVRAFRFQREIVSGRLDILVLGDTGQGKSKAAEDLMEYYNLGIKVSGESAKRTGLLYTIPTRESEAAYIAWGVLPRHTGRLVFIDEANRLIESDGFGELTEARSAGEIAVAQTVYGRAKVETRLITMTNPAGRKTMGTHSYPILALLDLFKDRADIRRFTFVVGVSSNQIDDDVINQDIEEMQQLENPYISEICHNHLLKVWTLKPDQIHFTHEVEKLILELANHMCKVYVAEIPIAEPGDLRHKLARIATAAAARMNSFDKNKLVVTADAVNYAYNFLNELYSDTSLKFLAYSKAFSKFALTLETKERFKKEMLYKWELEWEKICMWLMVNEYTRPKEVAMAAELEEDAVKHCLGWMAANKLLTTTARNHFTKTEAGVSYLEFVLPEEIQTGYIPAEEVTIKGDDGDEF